MDADAGPRRPQYHPRCRDHLTRPSCCGQVARRATSVNLVVAVLGPLCVSADASYKDVDADSDGEGGEDEDENKLEGNAGADGIRVAEPERGRRVGI